MNLFREHFQREAARRESGEDDFGGMANASGYQLMLAKLADDRRRLKQIQSIERKGEVKRELLPDYAPWVDGVLQADAGGRDDVVVTVMIWRIDAGDYPGALDIADYAMRHDLYVPDRFERTLGTIVAEELSDAAKRLRDAKASGFDVGLLARAMAMTAHADMPDQVRAKLHCELGFALADSNPEQALDQLRRALQLHNGIGVKKAIEGLERKLKNTPTPPG